MTVRRLTRPAALGLALAALAAPTAAAQQDLRSPDTRDAAQATTAAAPSQDLRSPDTRDAALAQERYHGSYAPDAGQDLRSPDARDAADGRGTFNSPEVTVVKIPESAPASGSGLDWGDTGIGAGGMLGLVLLGLGATLIITHRKQGPRRQTATSG
jgi:hypothetical protein